MVVLLLVLLLLLLLLVLLLLLLLLLLLMGTVLLLVLLLGLLLLLPARLQRVLLQRGKHGDGAGHERPSKSGFPRRSSSSFSAPSSLFLCGAANLSAALSSSSSVPVAAAIGTQGRGSGAGAGWADGRMVTGVLEVLSAVLVRPGTGGRGKGTADRKKKGNNRERERAKDQGRTKVKKRQINHYDYCCSSSPGKQQNPHNWTGGLDRDLTPAAAVLLLRCAVLHGSRGWGFGSVSLVWTETARVPVLRTRTGGACRACACARARAWIPSYLCLSTHSRSLSARRSAGGRGEGRRGGGRNQNWRPGARVVRATHGWTMGGLTSSPPLSSSQLFVSLPSFAFGTLLAVNQWGPDSRVGGDGQYRPSSSRLCVNNPPTGKALQPVTNGPGRCRCLVARANPIKLIRAS